MERKWSVVRVLNSPCKYKANSTQPILGLLPGLHLTADGVSSQSLYEKLLSQDYGRLMQEVGMLVMVWISNVPQNLMFWRHAAQLQWHTLGPLGCDWVTRSLPSSIDGSTLESTTLWATGKTLWGRAGLARGSELLGACPYTGHLVSSPFLFLSASWMSWGVQLYTSRCSQSWDFASPQAQKQESQWP